MDTTEWTARLLAALEAFEREAAVARTGQRPQLGPVLMSIRDLASTAPAGTDPQLRHYLRNQSLEKARLFLLGRDAENLEGNCHGHREAPMTQGIRVA
jgi:hypothetical protein